MAVGVDTLAGDAKQVIQVPDYSAISGILLTGSDLPAYESFTSRLLTNDNVSSVLLPFPVHKNVQDSTFAH